MLQDQTATNKPPSPQVTWAPQQQETFMLDRLSHLQILQLNVGRNWAAHETTLQPAFGRTRDQQDQFSVVSLRSQ